MTVAEIRAEELDERLENKNACIIGKLLEGQLFQGESFVIESIKKHNF